MFFILFTILLLSTPPIYWLFKYFQFCGFGSIHLWSRQHTPTDELLSFVIMWSPDKAKYNKRSCGSCSITSWIKGISSHEHYFRRNGLHTKEDTTHQLQNQQRKLVYINSSVLLITYLVGCDNSVRYRDVDDVVKKHGK